MLFKRRIDIGGVNNNFKGDFQEAEGLDMYYDLETGRKALLIGVTIDLVTTDTTQFIQSVKEV